MSTPLVSHTRSALQRRILLSPLEKRKAEAERIRQKYPDRIPVRYESAASSLRQPWLKYLTFRLFARKRIGLTSQQSTRRSTLFPLYVHTCSPFVQFEHCWCVRLSPVACRTSPLGSSYMSSASASSWHLKRLSSYSSTRFFHRQQRLWVQSTKSTSMFLFVLLSGWAEYRIKGTRIIFCMSAIRVRTHLDGTDGSSYHWMHKGRKLLHPVTKWVASATHSVLSFLLVTHTSSHCVFLLFFLYVYDLFWFLRGMNIMYYKRVDELDFFMSIWVSMMSLLTPRSSLLTFAFKFVLYLVTRDKRLV